MSALRPLQTQFQDYLLGRPSAILDRIAEAPREDCTRLLDIYRNAYLARLVEALGSDFPKLRRIAGEATFDALARAYLRARPSRHRSVRWLGEALPDFLAGTPPYDRRPTLAEMASFEWALAAAFDAADAEPQTVTSLAAMPPHAWGSLLLVAHPSARRLDLRTNVPELWQRLEVEAEAGEPETTQGSFVPWLVWRHCLSVKFRRLPEDEAWAWDRMAEGRSFAEFCEGLGRWASAEAVAPRAAGLLRMWIEAGLVARIEIDAPLSF